MDWSEILTQSEGEYMQKVLPKLEALAWAKPLVSEIISRGGITYANKPLLFEARVAHALAQLGTTEVEYEYATGVKDSRVDFRVGTRPKWLLEVVSIGRSKAVEAATFQKGAFYGTVLSSPRVDDTQEERKQSEEHEGLLVVQKIGEKVHDKNGPVKFPTPCDGQYHAVVVDMRGHLGGGDIEDWKQIAFGAEVVAPEFRKQWLGPDSKPIPMMGVFHPSNTMRSGQTARERLHAIVFVAEEQYADGALLENAWFAGNPHLISDEARAREILSTLPLWKLFQEGR